MRRMLYSHRPRTGEFEAAAMPYLNDIYRTATRLLGAEADVAVQDAYLQAWKSFGQFRHGTNFRVWLFTILFHTIHQQPRKWVQPRRNTAPDEVLHHDLAPDASIPDHLTDEEINAALAEVPQECRAVVLLVDVEEFSHKEAAGILGVPAGTILSRLSRGRCLLREQLCVLAETCASDRQKREGKIA